MKQNVASQVIGAQMVSASDGSAFTGAVTVSVTGDAGTQATGSVGAGACTHEGNGFHTYSPAQAETNYAHIAFTFTGTGAIPATVQVFTTFPQTGDGFARLGAPAGASVSADVAAIKSDTAAILVDTGTTLDAAIADLPTNAELATALGTADDAVLAAIAGLNNLSQANIRTAVGLATANLDTQLADLPTNSELATALGTADDAVLAAIAALNNLSAAQVNAEVVAALTTDTYAEPGQGTPAATASISTKIGYLYKAWRNRSTQTATQYSLYNDDATTIAQKATFSDDATTADRGEIATGP